MPILFITGFGDIPAAVRAMKAGAFEFLTKPVVDSVLLDAIRLVRRSRKDERVSRTGFAISERRRVALDHAIRQV